MNKQNLSQECANPDKVEDGVGENTLKNVDLAMDLPAVDFVEECHNKEGIEDHGEKLGGGRVDCNIFVTLNIAR